VGSKTSGGVELAGRVTSCRVTSDIGGLVVSAKVRAGHAQGCSARHNSHPRSARPAPRCRRLASSGPQCTA
jgi:hypothetical protein